MRTHLPAACYSSRFGICLLVVTTLWAASFADVPAIADDLPARIVPEEGLLLESLAARGRGRRRRRISHDAVQAALVRSGSLRPKAGDVVKAVDGTERKWEAVKLEGGGLRDKRFRRGAYLYIPIESEAERTMILGASGQSIVYVNGQPRTGDVYSRGAVHMPVKLKRGTNDFLFRAGRGPVQMSLSKPSADIYFAGRRMHTDLPRGEDVAFSWASIGVANTTDEPAKNLTLVVNTPGHDPYRKKIQTIPPRSVRRISFKIPGGTPQTDDHRKASIELLAADGRTVIETSEMQLRVVDRFNARDPYRQTFRSNVDGSVQYYAVKQAKPISADDPPPGIIMTCHGASVEASSHVAAFCGKTWAHVISPTNRHRYGYDWEDFGRKDAMEALADAQRRFRHDPTKTYLSGHSMGGHGTWHIGVTHPDRFAAIGPSAGWISYWAYAGGNRPGSEEPVQAMLRRATNTSDTIGLATNLKNLSVYILHGQRDGNVSANQARRMAEVLEGFHHDWKYHEQPGSSHWWNSHESDASFACVDWPEMTDAFARHVIPPRYAVRNVEFSTANPGVSNRCHWASIEGQLEHGEISRVNLRAWHYSRRFEGTTENVAVLRLDTDIFRTAGSVGVKLDDQNVGSAPIDENTPAIYVKKTDGKWAIVEKPSPAMKGPHRYGPIKNELDHNFLFVYGTQGTEQENAWAFAKARFDCETYLYRGNATVETVADTDFSPDRYKDRAVVLYGNSETNAAWNSLLGKSPVQVTGGQITLGERVYEGDDLAALFVQPRPDSDVASVIAVSGTGPIGMRMTSGHTFFYPFIRYPDCTIMQAAGLESDEVKTLAAGYFGLDWSVEGGQFAYETGL